MKERILEFLRHENKTSSQFADEIGVQPSSVSHIISGRNKPSLDFVIKMLQQYAELSTDWLIFGKGNMYKDSTTTDLFNIGSENTEQETAESIGEDISQSLVKELFNDPENESIKSDRDNNVSVQKLLLIYSDNSFREYKPG